MIYSTFIICQGKGKGLKGRFVINLIRKCRNFSKISDRMETVPSFVSDIHHSDRVMSFYDKGVLAHVPAPIYFSLPLVSVCRSLLPVHRFSLWM